MDAIGYADGIAAVGRGDHVLDLRQVRTFLAVAREGSFTRAARVLHYAQSSVTAQVQGLETELGAPLFDRLPRSVELTPVGRSFLPNAERLIKMAEEAYQAAQAHGEPAGPLALSASESVLTYRLPQLLRTFQADYPDVRIALQPAALSEFGPPIHASVDIAISINERIMDPQLIVHVLRREPIRAVVSREHPLAAKRRVTPEEIAAEQLLLTEETCSYRAVFERALTQSGARPRRTLQFASVEAIKQCAHARMGVAVLPEMVVADDLKAGTLVVLRWHPTELKVYTQLVRRRDRWFSPAMSAFWNAAIARIAVRRER
jgi:DNA-binding transcriptional LysR family regulator